jgi:hypothetical protein
MGEISNCLLFCLLNKTEMMLSIPGLLIGREEPRDFERNVNQIHLCFELYVS